MIINVVRFVLRLFPGLLERSVFVPFVHFVRCLEHDVGPICSVVRRVVFSGSPDV